MVAPGDYPYCAMMQVAAEDTFNNYVICRGWDPRVKKFFDYSDGVEGVPDAPGVPVAKPYGCRTAGTYKVGQVFPAVLPLTKQGQNPGVAATSEGHPEDLDENVEILYTEDATPRVISWILLDVSSPLRRFELKEDLEADNVDPAPSTATNAYMLLYDDDPLVLDYVIDDDEDTEFWVYSFTGWTGTGKDGETAGTRGWCTLKDSRWEVVGGVGSSIKFATLVGPLLAGYSAQATISKPAAESGDEVTVYDDDFIEAGKKLESGSKVTLVTIDDTLYVLTSDTCPVDQ